MKQSFAPMLASTYAGEDLTFPVLVTPKIDGVRAIKLGGKLVSRSLKQIPNIAIRTLIERILPEDGIFDGELSVDSDFQNTVSAVMSISTALPNNLKFYWFDWVQKYDYNMPYSTRVLRIYEYMKNNKELRKLKIIIPLIPAQVDNTEELSLFEKASIRKGYEGVVIRSYEGRYKCGRSTIREGLMIKIKRSEDFEATIIDTEELMHNLNEEKMDNFGRMQRSSAKDNKRPSGTLGALVANAQNGKTFKIGTGFSSQQRHKLWVERDNIIGKLVKYRSAGNSKDNVPKCAVFIGLRHADDIS
jgi:DNA ligase-1